MRLLILSQYFPPEVGAPQNRLFELALHLKSNGINVTVLTAMPNYPQMKIYEGYRGRLYKREEMNGITVHRSSIVTGKRKDVVFRLLNYFSFVFSSFFCGWWRVGKVDYIFCESPPLFLGISAYLLKKVKGAKLIFNVSDLWPESAEKLGIVTNGFFLKRATKLEEFLYRNSELITGQTQGIVKNISSRFPSKIVHWLPNGAELNNFDSNLQSNWRTEMGFAKDDFIFLYAGILGHAQGLEVILKAADLLKEQAKIKFVLLGSGPEKEKLLEVKKQLKLENVHFLETVPKSKIVAVLAGVDAGIIPLRNIELFRGAIPSKIFELLAMKKPILLGVEGEAKELFIEKGKCGLAFEPENATDLADKVLYLSGNPLLISELGSNGYEYVKNNFSRKQIADRFCDLLTDFEEKNKARKN